SASSGAARGSRSDGLALGMARGCRNSVVGDRAVRCDGPFWRATGRRLCSATFAEWSHRSRAYRTEVRSMTELEQPHPIVPQPWMGEPATLAVLGALAAGSVETRFVGGSVRDALLGLPIGDIDIATPVAPERVTELLEKAGIKVVPTGLDHGTVT